MTDPVAGDSSALNTIGQFVGGLVLILGGWLTGRRTNNAARDAEVARHEVDRTESHGERDVVQLLRDELKTARTEFQKLRSDFEVERKRRWQLEDHIAQLERLMRAQGMDVPQLLPQDAAP